MSYHAQWLSQIDDSTNPTEYQAFVERYYNLEKTRMTRFSQPARTPSKVRQQKCSSPRLGQDMVVYLGFLDGIKSCLQEELDLETVEDDTELTLKIDFEKLYWKMHEVKADWLYYSRAGTMSSAASGAMS